MDYLNPGQDQNKPNIRMAYVILHYNNTEDTIRCVSSIQNSNSIRDSIIVIIDNASPNKSGDILRKKYGESKNILFIQNNTNYGFSEGNNIGYRLIRKKYNANFITICNNDLEFPDKDFTEKVEQIYKEIPFHVLGPDIYNPRLKIHQNPLGYTGPTILQSGVTVLKNLLAEIFFPIYWVTIGKKYCKKMEQRQDSVTDFNASMENVPLMGACFVFSKDFIEAQENAFETDTFLYYEEYLLYNRCMDNNYRMIYRPEIQVLHYEGGATKTTSDDLKLRHKHYIHNIKHAAAIYFKSLMSKTNSSGAHHG